MNAQISPRRYLIDGPDEFGIGGNEVFSVEDGFFSTRSSAREGEMEGSSLSFSEADASAFPQFDSGLSDDFS